MGHTLSNKDMGVSNQLFYGNIWCNLFTCRINDQQYELCLSQTAGFTPKLWQCLLMAKIDDNPLKLGRCSIFEYSSKREFKKNVWKTASATEIITWNPQTYRMFLSHLDYKMPYPIYVSNKRCWVIPVIPAGICAGASKQYLASDGGKKQRWHFGPWKMWEPWLNGRSPGS